MKKAFKNNTPAYADRSSIPAASITFFIIKQRVETFKPLSVFYPLAGFIEKEKWGDSRTKNPPLSTYRQQSLLLIFPKKFMGPSRGVIQYGQRSLQPAATIQIFSGSEWRRGLK